MSNRIDPDVLRIAAALQNIADERADIEEALDFCPCPPPPDPFKVNDPYHLFQRPDKGQAKSEDDLYVADVAGGMAESGQTGGQKYKLRRVRDIMPIREWLDSDYYLGAASESLYPYWKEHLIDIFENPFKYDEIVLTGSIGTGKTFSSMVMFVRKLYELSCFENIPLMFNMNPTSPIGFIYFSVTKAQARMTGFDELMGMLDSIPYFREKFMRDTNYSTILKYPQNLFIISASEQGHALGVNLIGSVLDEANFIRESLSSRKAGAFNIRSKVKNMYSSILNRTRSRFIVNGMNHSLSLLVSSSSHTSSFVEKKIEMSMDDTRTKIIETRLWEVKPRSNFSSEVFWVFKGAEFLDPQIVDNADAVLHLSDALGLDSEFLPHHQTVGDQIKSLPQGVKNFFIDIPMDFKKSFEIDIISSLKDIAGVAVAPLGKLLYSKKIYRDCLNDTIRHPFISESVTLSTGDSHDLKSFLMPRFDFIDKDKERFIHIDQSTKNDFTGIAMAYVSSYRKEGEKGEIRSPIVTVDMMLCITPPKAPDQISIKKIRDFVLWLRDENGMNIKGVTYDWFASAESIQAFTERGMNSDVQSLDKSDTQYVSLINLMAEGRLVLYDYRVFREELYELEHDRQRRKVDHPSTSSKDVADAVAGAVYLAISKTTGGGVDEDLRTLDQIFKINDTRSDRDIMSAALLGTEAKLYSSVKEAIDDHRGEIFDETLWDEFDGLTGGEEVEDEFFV